jgi:molybdopterin-guanine dinucleotide biosynthesis protein MobB
VRASEPIPVVSVVGRKAGGKTTVLERLVAELVSRGYRVATARHHAHDTPVDTPGKDTWRHAEAGAAVTMVSSPTEIAVFRRVDRERTLDELTREAEGCDLLLTEGFGDVARARIEAAVGGPAEGGRFASEELFAYVGDAGAAPAGVTVLAPDDTVGLADLVEEAFLRGGGRDAD